MPETKFDKRHGCSKWFELLNNNDIVWLRAKKQAGKVVRSGGNSERFYAIETDKGNTIRRIENSQPLLEKQENVNKEVVNKDREQK